jgi:hypothetical protein
MSPDAAERWLEPDPAPPAPPPPAADPEREQRFDPAPGCIPVQGPYLNEADRPCAFPDGREIPSGVVVEPPPPEPADCAIVEGYDEDEAGLCAYPTGARRPPTIRSAHRRRPWRTSRTLPRAVGAKSS